MYTTIKIINLKKKLMGYISIHETRKTITRIYKCQMKQKKSF